MSLSVCPGKVCKAYSWCYFLPAIHMLRVIHFLVMFSLIFIFYFTFPFTFTFTFIYFFIFIFIFVIALYSNRCREIGWENVQRFRVRTYAHMR
jgi:hypothetical protein